VSAFGVFFMTQYLSEAVPTELLEAARWTDATRLRIFWHVVLPASRPAAPSSACSPSWRPGTTSSGRWSS
jgi:ABC-type glycerol-3-phosphate transport system permease component